jgi:hypothetical protein
MRASRLSIDRLSIELSGISTEEARRLVALVAEGLASHSGTMRPRQIAALHVELSAPASESLHDLAHHIVLETLSALRRTA